MERRGRLNRNARGVMNSMSLTLFAQLCSLSLGGGIEIQIEPKFRECLERYSK